jgi:hypothetical protein
MPTMTPHRIFTALVMAVAAISLFSAGAEAGKKKLYFGGPLGTFDAKRSPGGSSKSYKSKSYKSKSHKANKARKAKARAAAKAKARARAAAKRKAYAKAKAEEAARRRARANAAANSDRYVSDGPKSGPTESNTAVAPSTAAVLTRNQLARQKDAESAKSAPKADNDNDSVTVAETSDASVAPKPARGVKDKTPVDDGTGCKRFIPEVGMTVSVDC